MQSPRSSSPFATLRQFVREEPAGRAVRAMQRARAAEQLRLLTEFGEATKTIGEAKVYTFADEGGEP